MLNWHLLEAGLLLDYLWLTKKSCSHAASRLAICHGLIQLWLHRDSLRSSSLSECCGRLTSLCPEPSIPISKSLLWVESLVPQFLKQLNLLGIILSHRRIGWNIADVLILSVISAQTTASRCSSRVMWGSLVSTLSLTVKTWLLNWAILILFWWLQIILC